MSGVKEMREPLRSMIGGEETRRGEPMTRDDASEGAKHTDRSGKRLGRGLAALIGDLDGSSDVPARGSGNRATATAERMVPVGAIRRNPSNPRRSFDPVDLDELATSLRAHGFLSPIVVRPAGDEGAYEIVAGERRWRAAQRAELRDVPVIVRQVDDRLALELAIVENVQRTDLNPIDEARGYEQLMESGYTQSELSEIIGKSRSHVANTLRLMKLPDAVRRLVGDGSLSAGHARALVPTDDPAALAAIVIERDLNVRETEELVKRGLPTTADGPDGGSRATTREKDPDTRALERRLTEFLGSKVSVDHGQKGGRLVIRYADAEEFETLLHRLEANGTPPNFD